MKINDNLKTSKATTETTNTASLNIPFPVYVRIENDDQASLAYHKYNGTPISNISLRPGLPKHLYAVFAANSQAEADTLNRELGNMNRKDSRNQKKKYEHETSMTPFEDAGIDLSAGYVDPEKHLLPDLSKCKKNDPAEIIAYKTVLNALNKELDELTNEKLRMCQMIAHKIPERTAADNMSIRQSTLNGRKNAMLKELRNKMKDFE